MDDAPLDVVYGQAPGHTCVSIDDRGFQITIATEDTEGTEKEAISLCPLCPLWLKSAAINYKPYKPPPPKSSSSAFEAPALQTPILPPLALKKDLSAALSVTVAISVAFL